MAGDLDAIRLEARCRRLQKGDIHQVFEAAAGQRRVAWRQDDTAWVGIGMAWEGTAHGPNRIQILRKQAAQVSERLDWSEPDLPWSPRFFCGLSFHPDHRSEPPWDAFPGASCWLPHRLVTWHEGDIHETIIDPPKEPIDLVQPHATAPADLNQSAWTDRVRRASQAIIDGDVSKVVLARSRRQEKASAQVPAPASGATTRAGFHLEPSPGHWFWGQSPERLIQLKGETATTHALAGSAPRGATAEEDAALGRALQESQKDTLEHELVVSFIRDRLAQAGAKEEQQRPRRLLRLPTIQHLETPIQVRVPPGTHVLSLVEALHPTPAVAGSPRGPSLRLIEALEPFPRGWYAGAVGWFDLAGNGTFQVALRSGLSTPEAGWRFAGAGIVAGSDPEQEWQETEWKLAALDHE